MIRTRCGRCRWERGGGETGDRLGFVGVVLHLYRFLLRTSYPVSARESHRDARHYLLILKVVVVFVHDVIMTPAQDDIAPSRRVRSAASQKHERECREGTQGTSLRERRRITSPIHRSVALGLRVAAPAGAVLALPARQPRLAEAPLREWGSKTGEVRALRRYPSHMIRET